MTPPPDTSTKIDLSSAELIKSYVISLVIAVPCLLLTYFFMDFHADWPTAHIVFAIIMIVSLVNFVTLVILERFRSHIGSLTLPALLAACAIVVMIILVEGVNRFVPVLDFHWIYTGAALIVVLKYLALFREKNLALKFYLAVNIIALTALWCLGADNKVALPF